MSAAAAGFEPVARAAVPALATVIEQYRHAASGARHVHLARQTRDNAFVLGFLTPPPDDSGVVHVLEHLTLCGSRRFPQRDAFFRMLHRSLATTMNARAAVDSTSYHFATAHQGDFEHLLALFVDAAFFPLLDPLDFAREAHRLEFERPDDPDSPLRRAGVVWNEMRGAMASPARVQRQALRAALFPDACYRYNPGGEPAAIARLDNESVRAYHARHFCPANAVFMTAGPVAAATHQARFDALALSRCEPGEAVTPARTARFAAPRRDAVPCAGGAGEDTTLLVGWLLGESDRPAQALRAALLGDVLLGDGDAPLRAFLEGYRGARAPAALCGVDDEPRESLLGCGLAGVAADAAGRAEDDILAVVDTLAGSGLAEGRLRASIDRVALQQRVVEAGRATTGLALLLRLLPVTLRGADPAAMLDVETGLRELRADARDPAWLPALLRSRLLDNPHRAALTLRVDPTLAAAASAEEAALRETARVLDAPGRARIVDLSRRLAAGDGRGEQAVTPPGIRRAELDRRAPYIAGSPGRAGGLPVSRYRLPCNGVTDLVLALDPGAVDDAAAADLALLLALLPELGFGGLDARTAQARQAAAGAGFAARLLVRAAPDGGGARVTATVSARSLSVRRAELAAVLVQMLGAPRLDDDAHLRAVLARLRARRRATLTDAGHRLAMSAAADGASVASTLLESAQGLRALYRLDALQAADGPALAVLQRALAAAQRRLWAGACEVAVVDDGGDDDALARALAPLAEAGGVPVPVAETRLPEPPRAPRVHVCDGPVGFLARAWPGPPAAHEDAPLLAVLGPLVADGCLHAAIRERGGAYGAGAMYDGDSATFRLFSYRDTRIAGTRADFDRVPDWLDAASRDTQAVERAVLRTVAAEEPAGSPAAIARGCFLDALHGRGAEHRQRWREAVLRADGAALRRVAARWLRPSLARDAVMASEAALRAAGLQPGSG